jgi:butyryl-CoA dehydrogenase
VAAQSVAVCEQSARLVLAASAEGDELRTQMAILRRLARVEPANVVELSRSVARAAVELERYPL